MINLQLFFVQRTDKTFCRNQNHRMMIDFELILPTLERFLSEQNSQLNQDLPDKIDDREFTNVSTTLSRLISSNDINLFWKSYHPNFSKEKKLVWDALDTNLNKYLLVNRC